MRINRSARTITSVVSRGGALPHDGERDATHTPVPCAFSHTALPAEKALNMILVVEDHAESLGVLLRLLTQEGYAASGGAFGTLRFT